MIWLPCSWHLLAHQHSALLAEVWFFKKAGFGVFVLFLGFPLYESNIGMGE